MRWRLLIHDGRPERTRNGTALAGSFAVREAGAMTQAAQANTAALDRYVPRIATNWDDDAPGRRWQELDATLCFVDISGFTSLSEKLARRGRIGAEELTAVLNHVFGSMLELAYQQGGSLLKFGGDALLLLFTGHDHASRAASTAVEMRTALKAAAEYKTSAGRLRLRMSVGIYSGPVHLFRVGESHRELVVAGIGGTTTTVMEKTADPGEIVVSEGTRLRLPEDAVGRRKGPGWLLRWRKAHCLAPGPVMRETRDSASLEQWIPRGLRDYLSAGEIEPEHRIATVGFVRYCGVDHAMETDGPDTVGEAIAKTMAVIQEAADAEGVTFLGTDINEDGGKAILVAGAPATLEEDESRMLRTVRRVVDAGTALDVHVGVHQGHVFTGEVGTQFRATYTVMGDTVNLSARLMAAAHAGTIYATANVLDQAGTLYSTEALPPLHLKGKEEPVKAYAVGAELGERTADERDDLPFVGRSEDLARLTAHIEAALHGVGSVVTVIGEAGRGKSRLVREAVKQSGDARVVTIRAEPYGSATPYRALRDPLRSVLGIERASSSEMAAALEVRLTKVAPDLLPMLPLIASVAHIDVPDTREVFEIEPRFRLDRLTRVVVSLMERLLDEAMVLVIEDAHWMDAASAHLLFHVLATAAERPWGIIVTRRVAEGGLVPEDSAVIEVNELSQDEAEQLVLEATLATPLHPHEVQAIVERTDGNPLFIGEVLRLVRESGSVDELPDSLGSLVSTSIDALPPLTRRILRYASVLGRSFRVSTVTEILSEDDLELDAATRDVLRGFLEPSGEGRLSFRTAMVRDVAYDGLSFRRREDLHRRAARAIEKTTGGAPEDAADQLAMHYSLGNDHENTWHYGRIAADRATRAFANAEAAIQLQRVLAAERRLSGVRASEVAGIWTQLGDVREQAGQFDHALDAYRKASRLIADDPVAKAEVLLKRAWVRERAGDYPMALRESTRARNLVAAAAPDTAHSIDARATAFQATVRQRQGRVTDALHLATTATALAERSGEQAALARAFSVTAWAHLVSDDQDALDLCQESLNLYRAIGDLVGQNKMNNNLGVLAYFDDRWDDAVAYYGRSRDGAERVGNLVDAAFAEANIGEVLLNQRRIDEAEAHLTAAARVFRATGDVSMAIFAELQLGRVFMARGDLNGAEQSLHAVVDESREQGFAENAAEAAFYLADCTIRKGEYEDALAELDRAISDAGEQAAMFELIHIRFRGAALAGADRVDDALELLQHGLDIAREKGQRYEEALILRVTARSLADADPTRSLVCAEQSNQILETFGVQVSDLVPT